MHHFPPALVRPTLESLLVKIYRFNLKKQNKNKLKKTKEKNKEPLSSGVRPAHTWESRYKKQPTQRIRFEQNYLLTDFLPFVFMGWFFVWGGGGHALVPKAKYNTRLQNENQGRSTLNKWKIQICKYKYECQIRKYKYECTNTQENKYTNTQMQKENQWGSISRALSFEAPPKCLRPACHPLLHYSLHIDHWWWWW